jgi:hypothetical protein
MNQFLSVPWVFYWGNGDFYEKSRRYLHLCVSCQCVIATSDKLKQESLTPVSQIFIDSMRPVINSSPLTTTQRKHYVKSHYMSLNRKPAATQINKNFLSQNFSYLSLLTPAINLYFRISPRIFLKNLWRFKLYTQGPGGNWFMKRNLKSKSSCQAPFNYRPEDTLTPLQPSGPHLLELYVEF